MPIDTPGQADHVRTGRGTGAERARATASTNHYLESRDGGIDRALAQATHDQGQRPGPHLLSVKLSVIRRTPLTLEPQEPGISKE